MSNIKPIDISLLRVNGGTQSRAEISRTVVADYAEAMGEGASFPPLVVFYDGAEYWLADGFHRYEAYSRAGIYEAIAEVRQGTQRDAVLFSVGANASHGLRRTNDDKRRAVMVLLNDEEWSAWSDREIARRAAVHHDLVGRMRGELSGGKRQIEPVRTVERNGTIYQQNTAAIGKPAQKAEEQEFNPMAVRTIHQQVADDLPDNIKAMQTRREEAKQAKSKPADDQLQARVDELEESQSILERDHAAIIAENKKFEAMRVLYEKGGFEAVIAAKDEEIRVLQGRVYSESAGKAEWMRKAEFWKKQAKQLGWRDTRFDAKPEADDDDFLAAVSETEG